MTKINMPVSADAALDALGGLGKLLTAKNWERAAIVAALVGPPSKPGPKSSMGTHGTLSIDELAAQKIVGLRDINTIRRYRDAWFGTAENPSSRSTPVFGQELVLPDEVWVSTDRRSNNDASKESGGFRATKKEIQAKAAADPEFVKEVFSHAKPEVQEQVASALSGLAPQVQPEQSPEQFVAAIKTDPKVAEAAAKALSQSDHPVFGKPPETADGKALKAKIAESQAASDSINLLSDARDLIKEFASKLPDHHLDGLDREHAMAVLQEVVVQSETLRMELGLLEAEAQK